ncbi:hypothetical protein JCM11491_004100 [Sporobolomyces phaffii]
MSTPSHGFYQLPNDSQGNVHRRGEPARVLIDPASIMAPGERVQSELADARWGKSPEALHQERLADHRHRQYLEQLRAQEKGKEQRAAEARAWRDHAKRQHMRNRPDLTGALPYVRHSQASGTTLSEFGSADNARQLLKEVLHDHENVSKEANTPSYQGRRSHSLGRQDGTWRKRKIYGLGAEGQ